MPKKFKRKPSFPHLRAILMNSVSSLALDVAGALTVKSFARKGKTVVAYINGQRSLVGVDTGTVVG